MSRPFSAVAGKVFRSALPACTTLILVVAMAPNLRAASLFDPALRFRALRSEHFVVYFHQGEDRLAQHLAAIAEETWRTLRQPLGVSPPPLTHVVLADQTELANGYATPLPRDTIVIYAVRPSGSAFDFDDWLRLAFTHEFTHIVHLDRSEGWARALHSVFGRTSFAFPNLFLPAWQVEGLATYEESVITGEGRLHAGDFQAIVREAARAHALEPLDRVNGGLTDWPGAAAWYAYGAGFHGYLAERFGAEKLAALAAATARRVPYAGSRAFERVYGRSLGRLWQDYEQTATASVVTGPADNGPADNGPRRLTREGFSHSGPRFDPFPCATCAIDIFYSARSADGFPGLYRVETDGSMPHRITRRYLGSTTAIGRDVIYFDQMERRRNVGLYSDLYELSRTTGRVRQLTSDARLLDPDLSPDGARIACVRDRPGQRDLVLVSAAGLTTRATPVAAEDLGPVITTLVSEPETQFNGPRWSPDGASLALERHRNNALPEIVIVDVATRSVRVLASGVHARFVTPAWRPDGRAIVVAVAPRDETFNLYEFSLDGSPARQLTHTTGGATWPDVSADGKTLVFVGYTIGGYDVFSMPYPAPAASAGADRTRPAIASDQPRVEQGPPLPAAEYSPWRTLKPTSWSPFVQAGGSQLRVGAAVAGSDVLGYHAYLATTTWRVSSPAGAPTPPAAAPDWQLSYAYARWRPTFYVSASTETAFFVGPATDAGTPAASTLREREIEGGLLFPVLHVRVSHEALLSVIRAADDYSLPGRTLSRDRTAARAAWLTTSAHTYGYSISPEGGVTAGTTVEFVRRGLGSFADATTVTGDLRAYLPSFAPHHVVAVRLAGGASTGDPAVGRTFLLGGSSISTGVLDFGSRALSLLRGFPNDTFAGSHVALLNVDYRWPIARPQRGRGTWPLFVHTIHGAVFADAGDAWTRAFRAGGIKASAGTELSADIIAGYFFPLTATIGAAWRHDGGGAVPDGAAVHFRVGKAF
jgi:hypothetical protein